MRTYKDDDEELDHIIDEADIYAWIPEDNGIHRGHEVALEIERTLADICRACRMARRMRRLAQRANEIAADIDDEVDE